MNDLHEEHSSNVSLDAGIKDIGTGEVERGGSTAPVAGAGELNVGDCLLFDPTDKFDLGHLERGRTSRCSCGGAGPADGSEGGREGGDGGKNGSGLHFLVTTIISYYERR